MPALRAFLTREVDLATARKLPISSMEESMIEQVFGALFLATLFVPAAAVVAGVALLAWPRRRAVHRAEMTQHAHA
jgi:hypothetical protein